MVDLIAENDEDMRDLLDFLHGEWAQHKLWLFQGLRWVTKVDPATPDLLSFRGSF